MAGGARLLSREPWPSCTSQRGAAENEFSMATTTVSTVFAAHPSPLQKTGLVNVLTFPGKHRASAGRPCRAGAHSLAAALPKGFLSLPPASRPQESCPSRAGRMDFPLALARIQCLAAQAFPQHLLPSAPTPLPSGFGCGGALELQSALPSAPLLLDNPGTLSQWALDHLQLLHVTSKDVASSSYGHSPMKCKFNVSICNVKCSAL